MPPLNEPAVPWGGAPRELPQATVKACSRRQWLVCSLAAGAGSLWSANHLVAWVQLGSHLQPGHFDRSRARAIHLRGSAGSQPSGRPLLLPLGGAAALFAIRPSRAAPRRQRGAHATSLSALGVNPATCWPEGKPCFTTEYSEVYDLEDPKGSFTRVGQMILEELTSELPSFYEMPGKEVDWVSRSLQYNTQGGKMNRGLITVQTGVELFKHQGRTLSNSDLTRFAVLGWAVELLQACMLMADDMMDGSLTRRGQPCWYRLDNVGLLATNDFLMVEMFVYKIIKRHFGQEDYFPWLVDLFLETTFQTECGQLLDSICANCELEELTLDRWELLVKYKTAFYSFYLPVALSMIVAGIRDRKAYDTAREALLLMGVYFQAQDDYLDAFASPEELGKVGTDIADKKCSWLFAQAYHELRTDEAKQVLDTHYGKCEVGSKEEEDIKDVYRSLGLQELFQKYESEVEQRVEDFREKVDGVGLPWSIFERFFSLIHKRRK